MNKTFDDQKPCARRCLPKLSPRLAAGSLAALVGMSYAMATLAAHAPTDVGVGANSCAATVEMLGDAHFDRIVTAWSSGFISGSNTEIIVDPSRQRDIAAVSEALILRHVRTYCAAHPSKPLSSAVEALFIGLPAHR